MSYIRWIRGQVGRRKIFLAFASVVLFDEQGRILLQLRADFDIWGLPGGGLERGESILDCARRELYEESGLIANRLDLVGVYSGLQFDVTYPNGDQVQQYTVCLKGAFHGGQIRTDGVEARAHAFFDPASIPFATLPDYYAAMIRDALNASEPVFSPPYLPASPIPQIETIRPLIGRSLYIGVGATAVVVRSDQRVLMAQRVDNGLWVLPGGYSNYGENAAGTAVREAYEETGARIAPTRILGVYSPTLPWVYPNGDQVQPLITIFQAEFGGEDLHAAHPEMLETAWMTREQIQQLKTHPLLERQNRAVLEHLDGGSFVI